MRSPLLTRCNAYAAARQVLDADELGALLRIKLRVDEAAADAGYAALLQQVHSKL